MLLLNINNKNYNATPVVNFVDRQLGDYRYVKLKDIVNNFMVAYVGDGKLINYCNRSDILFIPRRGNRYFSDTSFKYRWK